MKEKIKNWLKEKFVRTPFFLPSTLIFIFTFVGIGFNSSSVRHFFVNSVESLLASYILTFLLYFFAVHNSEQENKFPFVLFYSVITFFVSKWF